MPNKKQTGQWNETSSRSRRASGRIIEVPDPKAKDDWVVVKVQTAPMCTEYKTFLSGGRIEYLGHEAAGEVVEVAQPGRVKVGDRWSSCHRTRVANVRSAWLANISTAKTVMILRLCMVRAPAAPRWPNISQAGLAAGAGAGRRFD